MSKKTIKFNEHENTSPDTFRDLSSIENYFENLISSNEIDPEFDHNDSNSMNALLNSMPENYKRSLTATNVEDSTQEDVVKLNKENEDIVEDFISKDGPLDVKIDEKRLLKYTPFYRFYMDELNRIHFDDSLMGSIIVETNLPVSHEKIDDSLMCDLLESIYLDLITTRTPSVILYSNECESKMKEKEIIGYNKGSFHPFILTDYNVCVNGNALSNYLILGFIDEPTTHQEFMDCVSKLIDDGFTNGEILYILLDLVDKARDDSFANKEYFDVITQNHRENIEPFFENISYIVKNKQKEGNSLECSLYNIYDDIRSYASDKNEVDDDEGGASNDEGPFLEDDKNQREISDEERCNEDDQQESIQEEKEDEKEIENAVEKNEFDFSSEDEEIDSIEIEEAESEEDEMVVRVRRDDR